jgi:UDP-N-acetylglucosamine 2-epimerase (non-hydrolysing)
LVGVSKEKIVAEMNLLLSDAAEREKMAQVVNPYGDGSASRQIADVLSQYKC